MDLTKEQEKLLLNEVLVKLEYGRSYKKYRQLEEGCKVWRRSYLRTYKDDTPSYRRTREQKYYLGLIFRSIQQFTADAKDALFSNNPFFTIRPRGSDPHSEVVAEAVQALMEYNTTIPIDYSMQFLHAYQQVCTFGVCYIAPFYDYRQMFKTDYYQTIDPTTGKKMVGINDELEAVCDHPDFDIPYPTRVIVDPNSKFGKFQNTCDWRIIERIRPYVYYLDKQEMYGFSNRTMQELRRLSGSTTMHTTGPNNFDENWNLNESKTFTELEYVGRIMDPRLRSKFDPRRRYIVTVLNSEVVVRADISAAPDGIGLHAMNLVPDLDGSHIGIGIADPAVDYQKAINEWYNLRMRGLQLAINPAWLVDEQAFPNWKQFQDHPPGKVFNYSGGVDARKVVQQLHPSDNSGATWEQMVGFTQRDHDLTVGTSASRLGSIEGEKRTATELSQVKEGADRRSNTLIYHAVRTGHKPLLWSMIKYSLNFWSTPKSFNLINNKNFQRTNVYITPEDVRNAEINLDVIDNTGGSIDQQMAFYGRLYEMSLMDPSINRTAALINMLKNSRIVNDPFDIITVDPMAMQMNMMANETMGGRLGPNSESDKAFKDIEKGTGSDTQVSSDKFIARKFR